MSVFLPFLPDAVFLKIVQGVLDKGTKALLQSETDMHRNVIDPFSMLFEMGCFELTPEDWAAREKTRQAQKTLSNEIGIIHQNILGSIQGWENLGKNGIVDVVNHDRKIIAEIKNKYNTVKGSDQIGLHTHLHDMVTHKTQTYRGYTAYYVEIIPKKPDRYDECFTPPNNKTGTKATPNERVRRIDGASFYALATGYPDALSLLYNALIRAVEALKSDFHFANKAGIFKFFTTAYGEDR